jgi:putative GTP pyrophosphokinase
MKQPNNHVNRTDGASVDASVREYQARRPHYEEFTAKVLELIRSLLRIRSIDVHLLDGRTKEIESFREKLGRASKSYTDPLSEISDLSGIRIIAYYNEDVDVVSELLKAEFDVDWPNSSDRRVASRPEEFGYQSLHYVVRLNAARRNLLEWSHLRDLRAEIQVRTVLQHAWAAISHKIQYKRESEVPVLLRRKLFRLSALLEIADDEFLSLRDETFHITDEIEIQLAAGATDLPIDRLTVEEFIRSSPEVTTLIELAAAAGFRTAIGLKGFGSELVVVAQILNLTRITELRDTLRESLVWASRYFEELLEGQDDAWVVNPAFVCILILIGTSPESFSVATLEEAGWGPEVATLVLTVATAFRSVSARGSTPPRQREQ